MKKCLIHFLCGLLLLVVPVGKHLNSHSQMFYKIDALTNLAIFTGKHLCWRFFLIDFIKNRLQYRCFPVNIAKCLSTSFYKEPFVSIHYTFQNFYVMIEFFGFFGYKVDIFHISCATALSSFITVLLESEVHCSFVYILFLCQNSC